MFRKHGITLRWTDKFIIFLELDQPIAAATISTTISHRLREANKRSHSLSGERRNRSRINVRQRRTETRSTWVYAWQPSSRHVTTGCKHNAKGLLQRMRQANCRPSNHSFGQDMASGAFHLQPLQPGVGNEKFLRAWWESILRGGLSQLVQPTLCLLQRPHSRCNPPKLLLKCFVSNLGLVV